MKCIPRAFTLLEVIIVLVIMVGIVAIVWPNLNKGMNKAMLREAEGVVMNSIYDSRFRAIQDKEPVAVCFEGNSGSIFSGPPDEAKKKIYYKLPDGIIIGGVNDKQYLIIDAIGNFREIRIILYDRATGKTLSIKVN